MLIAKVGRSAIIVLGLLGLYTSAQTACTFSDPPPVKATSKNPLPDGGSASDSGSVDDNPYGGGYGCTYGDCYGGYGNYGNYGGCTDGYGSPCYGGYGCNDVYGRPCVDNPGYGCTEPYGYNCYGGYGTQ